MKSEGEGLTGFDKTRQSLENRPKRQQFDGFHQRALQVGSDISSVELSAVNGLKRFGHALVCKHPPT